ncbi:MAG: flavin reductase family protein [Pseudomonadota bacterium]|nr:flavin reductase family protein [Pseudomonadota bacterium]
MSTNTTPPDITPGAFWRGLGQRPVGVTVVTSKGAEGPVGFLGLSFAHVSAAPPVVLVSVGLKTGALTAIRDSACFAVNQLSADQTTLAEAFGGALPQADRFAGIDHAPLVTGAPVFATALAGFDCRVIRTVETEGAITFFGHVVGLVTRDGAPLIAHQGGFRALTPQDI